MIFLPADTFAEWKILLERAGLSDFCIFCWQCFLYTSSTSFQNFLFRFAMTSNVPLNILSHVGQSQRFLSYLSSDTESINF